MTIYTPYTYLIGWAEQQKYYYGVKYAPGCHPDDFWKDYFTSSEYVKQFREEYGEPDVIQIRRTFDNAESAIEWEAKVLRRICAVPHPKMLNANAAGAILYTDEVRAKMSENNPTKRPEVRAKISASKKGKTLSAEHRAKMSAANKGKTGHKHNSAKPANIYCYKTNKLMAENVILNEYCRDYGYNQGNISKTATGKRNHHKGIYAKYI